MLQACELQRGVGAARAVYGKLVAQPAAQAGQPEFVCSPPVTHIWQPQQPSCPVPSATVALDHTHSI